MDSNVSSRTGFRGGGPSLLIIALFTLVFFRAVVFDPGGMIYSPLSDLVGQTFGWKHLVRQTLWSDGSLLLWNPHLMCGYPVLGNLNYALLFPFHLLYWLLPTGPAASWTYLLTHGMAAAACWYFLRTIGVRKWGALLGALAYGFGIRNLGHLTNGFVGHLETLPLLPLAFAFAHRLARSRRTGDAALLALALAGILCSAFAQIFLYLMFILPPWFAWLVFADAERRHRWLRPTALFGVTLLLAAGLVALHLLPALGLLPELSRSAELAPELYRLGSLTPRHFFTLVNPELFGRIGPDWSYWGSAYFWTLGFYTPLLLLPLAFLSFLSLEGRAERTFFLALVPALFLFAMGTHGPVYDLCHRFVPGVKLFREPARILFFHPLSLAVLAGFGWNGLVRAAGKGDPALRRRALALVAAAASLIGLLAAGYAIYRGGAGEAIARSFELSASFFGGGAGRAARYATTLEKLMPLTWAATLALFLATFGLLFAALRRGGTMKRESLRGAALLIVAADLLFFGRGYLQTADSRELFLEPNRMVQRLLELKRAEPPFRVADLSGALSDNQACIFGIDKVGGYDPINLAVTQHRFDEINRREGHPSTAWTLRVEPGFRREPLDRLNARYLVTRGPLDLPGMTLVDRFDPLPVTLQNYGAVRVPGVHLYRNERALPRAWFVPGAGSDRPYGQEGTPRVPAAVVQGPNRLRVTVNDPRGGLLVVSQAWSAGWRAEDTTSGTALEVVAADGMLAAVPLPADGSPRRDVLFRYRPAGWRPGLAVTALSLLAVAALLAAGRFRRGPPPEPAQRRAVEEEAEGDEQHLVDEGQRVHAEEVEDEDQVHGDGQREKHA